MSRMSFFRKKTPTTADEFFQSGFRLFQKKRHEDAESEFHKALALDSSHKQALFCLGQILQYRHDDRGAIALYERAAAAGVQDSELFFLLGTAYGNVEDFEKSRNAFARAVEINPNDAKARENMRLAELALRTSNRETIKPFALKTDETKINRSKRVDQQCRICKQRIEFVFFSDDQQQAIYLHSRRDIEVVNGCKRCGAFHHVRCAAATKERTSNGSQAPSFFEALKGAVGGGEGERKRFLDVLDRETAGLGCPSCGSFEFKEGFVKPDGSPIEAAGERVS
jgi:tetratricopeptide (TPR) repeat protein